MTQALKEELKFRKDQGENDLVIKNGTITVKKFPPKHFLFAYIHYGDGNVNKNSVMKILIANCCSSFPTRLYAREA